MSNQQIVGAILGCILAGAAGGLVVHLFSPKADLPPVTAGATPANATFSTQKQLAVVMSLAAGTTTSVQNTSASDVFILGYNYACTGVGTSQTAYTGAGLANLTVKAATTSTNLSSNTPASNVAANTNLSIPANNISTSTTVTSVASSSVQVPTPVFLDVPAGSYLTFITNATNTAACTFVAETVST